MARVKRGVTTHAKHKKVIKQNFLPCHCCVLASTRIANEVSIISTPIGVFV